MVTFCDKAMKIRKYFAIFIYVHFAWQDGQDRKQWKENHTTQVTKIPKTKRRKYGMNKTTDRHVGSYALIYQLVSRN